MADVTINSTGTSHTPRANGVIVWTSSTVGYAIYVDGSNDLKYKKTADGGASWGSVVNISTGTVLAHGIWFDKWTSGQTGTRIHIVWTDQGTDDAFYTYLDTNGDTLRGSVVTIQTGSTAVAAYSCCLSITKSRGGNLYCLFSLDAAVETGFYRSTDNGDTWSSRTNLHEGATNDWGKLYPGNYADSNDIDCLYYDASATALTLKVHDDSANSNSESSTIITPATTSTDGAAQWFLSAAVRWSDGHLIAVVSTGRDTAGADLTVWDINGTGSITQKTNITTDIDDNYHPVLTIDQNSDDLYVGYNGKRDGSETLGTTTGIYYTKSTDDGSSWSSGDTAYSESTGLFQGVFANPTGPRFAPVWIENSTNLKVNATNAVTFATGQTGDVPVGLVDFLGVAVSTGKSSVPPIALVDLLGVSPSTIHTATPPLALVDLLSVSPSTSKSAESSVGLVDLHGVNLTEPIIADAPAGLVDMASLSPDTKKLAESSTGLLEFTGVAPATFKSTAVPIALVDFLSLTPSTLKTASVGFGALDFLGVDPNVVHVANAVAGLLDITSLTPSTSKVSLITVGLLDVSSLSPDTDKSATVTIGLTDLTSLTPATAKSASVTVASVDLISFPVETDKSALVTTGLAELVPLAPDVDKTTTLVPAGMEFLGLVPQAGSDSVFPVGAVSLVPLAPETQKQLGVDIGLVTLDGIVPALSKSAGLSPGELNLIGNEVTADKLTLTPVQSVEFLGFTPTTSKTQSVTPSVILFVGAPLLEPDATIAYPDITVAFAFGPQHSTVVTMGPVYTVSLGGFSSRYSLGLSNFSPPYSLGLGSFSSRYSLSLEVF